MFDFIYSFSDFMTNIFDQIYSTFTYNDLWGNMYQFMTYVLVNFGVYLLFVIALFIAIWLVLSIAKVFYYILRELF